MAMPPPAKLFTDLSADLIFLAVQDALLGIGDVAIMLTCHQALLFANTLVLAMQSACFSFGDSAFFNGSSDALILMLETVVDLSATWVILFEAGIGCDGAGSSSSSKKRNK